ncbi:MAG: DUF523 domain-containing protein [candidate division WOR-3 bacterium]
MSIEKEKVAISACILGYPFRFDGKDKKNKEILDKLSQKYILVPICPEILSGLSVPRKPCSIKEESVLENESGEDKTHYFVKGAKRALKILENLGIKKVFLKEKSPSCGVNYVHFYVDKNITKLKKGAGVFTRILIEKGFYVEGID